ncbi:MAG: hypothetical protein HS111_20940 [Kofleriaceae bacterium]|nr:hypothetical protein [Kofleriaceae bacterium]
MHAVDGGMTTISIATARSTRSSRPSPEQVVRAASESRRAFHDKVLDGIRKFLEAHAMQGKTGPRDSTTSRRSCTRG